MISSILNKIKVNKKLILWHCAGWILFGVYDNLDTILFADNFYKSGLLSHQILFNLFDIVLSIIIFYSLAYVLRFYFRGKRMITIIGIALLFLLSYFFNLFASWLVIKLGLGSFPREEYARMIFIGALQVFVPIFIFALAYVFGMSVINKQRQINVLQRKNIQSERERRNKEIQNILLQNAFLRAQINPHFLYNTLNFFYAQSLQYSDDLAEGILTLSEIMRYSLKQQPDRSQEKVLLRNEINHIENVIKINRLRYKNNTFINFEVAGNTGRVYIVPFVLITLTENVFKHGEINSPDYPATIKITVDETGIQLFCHNKKKGGIKEPGTGIGLENTRQRLKNEYGDNFNLTAKDEDRFFTTELYIKFDQSKKTKLK